MHDSHFSLRLLLSAFQSCSSFFFMAFWSRLCLHFFFFCLPIHCSASPECTRKCNIILVYSLSLVLWNFLSQTNAAIKIFSLKFPCHVLSFLSKYHPGLICFYLCPKGFLKKRWFPVAMAALYWSVLSVEVQVKWLEQHSKRFPHQSTPASPVRC